jgi:H3 lysine-79-specific histone-lysine N-methyltransferase
LLRNLRRAINTRNGPMFLATMKTVNALLWEYKYNPVRHPLDGFLDDEDDALSSPPPAPRTAIASAAEQWDGVGIPQALLDRIIEETYQRAVGPDVPSLRRYEAFSSEVYGELTPRFVSEIVRVGGLGPGKLFLDLGSGVANVVLQAALETGCRAFGIEINRPPARLARSHVTQFEIRCKMWGVAPGPVELEEGDMLNSRRLDELLPQADVVLVNNKVFQEDCTSSSYPSIILALMFPSESDASAKVP